MPDDDSAKPARRSKPLGGNEFDFGAEEAIEEALESAPSEARTVVAEKIVDESLPVSPPIRRQAENVLYENRAIKALQRVVGEPNVYVVVSARDERFDLRVRYKDKWIGVIVKLARSNTVLNRTINQALSVINNSNWSRDVDAVLIVIQRTQAPNHAEGSLLGQHRLRVVEWEDERDNQDVLVALVALAAA